MLRTVLLLLCPITIIIVIIIVVIDPLHPPPHSRPPWNTFLHFPVVIIILSTNTQIVIQIAARFVLFFFLHGMHRCTRPYLFKPNTTVIIRLCPPLHPFINYNLGSGSLSFSCRITLLFWVPSYIIINSIYTPHAHSNTTHFLRSEYP